VGLGGSCKFENTSAVSNAQSRTIEYICGVLFATCEVDGKLCSTFSPSHHLLCRNDWFVITSVSDPQYEHPRPFLPSSHNALVHLLHQFSPSVALTTFLNHTQLHHHPPALASLKRTHLPGRVGCLEPTLYSSEIAGKAIESLTHLYLVAAPSKPYPWSQTFPSQPSL
jgi:hypothetical protein